MSLEATATHIDAKEAIRLAKEHAKQVFAGEQVSNLGLEALEYDDHVGTWLVTLGFHRAWKRPLAKSELASLAERMLITNDPTPVDIERDYKVFEIDAATGQVRRMRMYDTDP